VRKLAWAIVVLIVLVIALAVVQVVRSVPTQTVKSNGPRVVDVPGSSSLPWPTSGSAAVSVGSQQSIRTSGSTTPVPIASLAKMMTAYVILKDHPLSTGQPGPSIPITSADVSAYTTEAAASDSVLQVVTGEMITEQQALEALLVASADNVADILAQWDAGSVSAFVTKMNVTAHSLGMDHTKYTDPSGLETTTVSTASDQLVVARKAMTIPVFAAIVAMPAATFPVGGTVQNFDYDVGHDGIIGIKTGSDTAAHGCWAFAATRTIGGTKQIVYGVVLGIPAASTGLLEPALAAGESLANAIPGSVRTMTVVPAGTVVAYVTAPWRSAGVPVRTVHAVEGLVDNGTHVAVQVHLQEPGGKTVSKGQSVGTLTTAGVDGVGSTPLVTSDQGSGPSLSWRLTRL
jgi:serine-type D-Ala-D-Ala carboxypeptidase (penicillin-binding protein 5/6)